MNNEWEEFTIKMENGKKLKLDDFIKPEEITAALIESFQKAEVEAIRNHIKNNSIMLSSEFNLTKSFYYSICGRIYEVPPMVLGKSVLLDTDKILPDNVAFALCQTNQQNELTELKEILKKYVVSDGKSLRFKHISFKRNVKDFERIMELINELNN